jgi:hypothetical protein
MAKFFIPGNTPKRSEEIYEWIVRYVKEMWDCEIEPVRIFSLDYTHEGQQFKATVGQEDPRTGQLVVAILRAQDYLICTPYYGVRRGEPMRIDPGAAIEVVYFEGLDHARERFRAAVQILDGGPGEIRTRLQSAAMALSSMQLDEFPPSVAADFLSLKHKLEWRGSLDETIQDMSDAHADDAAATIRALYVDVLRPAPGPNVAR